MIEPSLKRDIGSHSEYRRFLLTCGAILVLCLSMKSPIWFADHLENDERIYWALTQNWLDNGTYSLQGTPILKELPPATYDKPLFHHPPMLPIMLMPFVATDSPNAAILVSWLGHALAIVGVAMMCWAWRRRSWSGTHFLLWMPVLAVALDPVLTFCSRKLWPDAFLGGFVGIGMGFVCLATKRRGMGLAVAGGLALGLAAMVKLPGLIVAPLALMIVAYGIKDDPARRVRLLLATALPLLAVIVPWFWVFHAQYGTFLPEWIRPDEALTAVSPHMARAMERPWHYYISESILVAPIVLVVLIGCVVRRRFLTSLPLVIPVAWVFLVWLALMFLHARGYSMKMRFLTVASPGVYAALAVLLASAHPKRSVFPLVALLAIVFGIVNIGFYLTAGPQFDEILSLPELVWKMATVGR